MLPSLCFKTDEAAKNRKIEFEKKNVGPFYVFVQGIEACGFKAHGGQDSPYVFVDLEGQSSWDVFSEILEKAQVSVAVTCGDFPLPCCFGKRVNFHAIAGVSSLWSVLCALLVRRAR